MSEDNFQSIFSDFESGIHEREWNKAVGKVKMARYALAFLTLVCVISFCLSYMQGGFNKFSMTAFAVYLSLFILSRFRPGLSFVVAIIACLAQNIVWIYEVFPIYRDMDGVRDILSLVGFIRVVLSAILFIFLYRGIKAAQKLDHLQSLEDAIQKEQ